MRSKKKPLLLVVAREFSNGPSNDTAMETEQSMASTHHYFLCPHVCVHVCVCVCLVDSEGRGDLMCCNLEGLCWVVVGGGN